MSPRLRHLVSTVPFVSWCLAIYGLLHAAFAVTAWAVLIRVLARGDWTTDLAKYAATETAWAVGLGWVAWLAYDRARLRRDPCGRRSTRHGTTATPPLPGTTEVSGEPAGSPRRWNVGC